ncbi:MAG TPA: amino acid adenylation domain-containing protein, partial [Thermoanaerobaculia bacterium]|nr:amino acid adenylation domain-containing protein [Thermoanaerobaculia bacterium]
RLGAGPEQRVGVLMRRSGELVAALLGILKSGAAYVPLDPNYPVDWLAYAAHDAEITFLLTEDGCSGKLTGRREIHAAGESVSREPEENPEPLAGPRNLAYVIYTSGSTGRPKGVALEHRGPVERMLWARGAFPAADIAGVLAATSICFDLSVFEIFAPLSWGGAVILADNALALPSLPARHEVTLVNTVPSAMAELASGELPSALRTVNLAGEALMPQLVERIYRHPQVSHVFNLYGPTEDTTYSTGVRVERGAVRVSIGRPLPGTRSYVLDRRLQPVPGGVPGELFLAGAGGARGYFGRPDLTAEKFIPDPFGAVPGGRLYRTGDLARWLPSGELEHLGRIDHQVKVRGFRIELGEIEAALLTHPEVRQATVMVREVAGSKALVGYLSGERSAGEEPRPAAAALREHLRSRLPEHMVPAFFVQLPALPLTPNGKVNRKALPAPALPVAAAAKGRLSGAEEQVAAIWCEVLDLPRVGSEDNFFDLGGHSLLLPRVQAGLRERLGREVTLVDLLTHTTVRALARHLEIGLVVAEPAPGAPRKPIGGSGAIAIVGLAGRFPGAPGVESLWANLCAGVSSIARLSDEELAASGVAPEMRRDPRYVPAAGLLDGVELFDAGFFGYSPREAELMDPQQRLFLECAWEALEDAGYDSRRTPGPVGMFASLGFNRYLHQILTAVDPAEVGALQLALANDKDFLATRVSYKLDLTGPSMTVQTACSSSLVAVHTACRNLQQGDCDMALAGGVSIVLPQRAGYLYEEGGIASPDGCCRVFDASARGTVFGSGAGIVVLKRLEDALADGDTIRAVLLGSAVNNDGGSGKAGYTAPSVAGQAAVISSALAAAGVDPATVSYVEAHGTGTPLGDPIEVQALAQAFRRGGAREVSCALGSVKSNLGHLDTAAGVTGLIKTVLALRHGFLPPSLGYSQPNPQIDFAAGPFHVQRELAEWERGSSPRRAGVSSFGIGGTNAHAVLEEPPAVPPSESGRPWHLLVLSARTPEALERKRFELADHLDRHPDIHLADAAYTLQLGRRPFAHRCIAVGLDAADAAAVLRGEAPARLFSRTAPEAAPPVVFLFPGQGSQRPGMGAGLYQAEPVFRQEIDRCCEILLPILGFDLRELLLAHAESEEAARRLAETEVTQPALFVIEHALTRLWRSWGVQPQAMIGHSIGEYVAACLAGVFSLEDALALVAARGRLAGSLPPGAMLAVSLPEAEAARRAEGSGLAVAAVNAPDACVLSGPVEAVERLAARLVAEGIEHRRLRTSHAFHSPALDPVLDRFRAEVARLDPQRPWMPWISTLSGTWIRPEEATDPGYWARHLREAVRFADGVEELLRVPGRIYLEVGPGRALSSLIRQRLGRSEEGAVLASLPRTGEPEEDVRQIGEALGRLWLAGAEIDWSAVHADETRRRIPLPVYPFERQRYWIEGGIEGASRAALRRPAIQEIPEKLEEMAAWFYVPSWQRTPRP